MKQKIAWMPRLPVVLVIVLSLAMVAAIVVLRHSFQKPPHVKKIVQQLTMIQPPPPPPVAEQAPQPPEMKEEPIEAEIPEQQPEPAPEPEEAPPLGELGLDADGVAGADAFGLSANKGGQALLGGSGGSAMLWYGGQIKDHVAEGLQNLLADTPAMRYGYDVLIEVWVGADGRLSRSALAGGSGQAEIDQAISNALLKLKVDIGQPPPDTMPQPVKIRLISKV